jgi:soluble lytic murein transglycosylase
MLRLLLKYSVTFLVAYLVSAFGAHAMPAEDVVDAGSMWSQERIWYRDAVKELRTGVGPRYLTLRSKLDHYPLAVYLDALRYEGDLHDTLPEVIAEILDRSDGSPVGERLLTSYVRHKIGDREWRAVISVTDREGLDTELTCQRAHALLKRKRLTEANGLIGPLWTVGKSQIKACDPLFSDWLAGAGPGDDLVWQRALNAAGARNARLMRYIKRFASKQLTPALNNFYGVYLNPERVTRSLTGTPTQKADIATMGVTRLARVNPLRALTAMESLDTSIDFSTAQRQQMVSMIVRHSLFARSAAPESWVIEQVDTLRDDELTGIFLRKMIAENRWLDYRTAYQWLSQEAQVQDEWRYWRAMGAAEGEAEEAATILEELAESRGFHAYLAAAILDQPLSLNMLNPEDRESHTDRALRVVSRVQELSALGQIWESRSEFRSGLDDPEVALALAEFAATQGWHTLAIEASAAARAWDRLDLRFPRVYEDDFAKWGEGRDLEVEDLIAIARRESALEPRAISEANARGLMQVVPATARITARKHNIRYNRRRLREPSYNILVGSRYYADLLSRYDDNRVLALAAYNAGPNRVRRWTDGDKSVARWVDTIPFKETREYVRAVLAYNVIYRTMAGKPATLLTEAELNHQY